jgi:HlyD family secretion protein
MFRVKLHINPQILDAYRGYVKAGMTGNAYVKVQTGASWPASLEQRLPDVR